MQHLPEGYCMVSSPSASPSLTDNHAAFLTFGTVGAWKLASATLHLQNLLDVDAALLVLGFSIAVGLCSNPRDC